MGYKVKKKKKIGKPLKYKIIDLDGDFKPFYYHNLEELRNYVYELWQPTTPKEKKEWDKYINSLNTFNKIKKALLDNYNIKLIELRS